LGALFWIWWLSFSLFPEASPFSWKAAHLVL
jgi:hypothetical protein